MTKLDPPALEHYKFHQSLLHTQGVYMEIEEVSDNMVWIRVRPRHDLNDVVSPAELRNLVQGVFRFLPYKVFVTVERSNQQDGYALRKADTRTVGKSRSTVGYRQAYNTPR